MSSQEPSPRLIALSSKGRHPFPLPSLLHAGQLASPAHLYKTRGGGRCSEVMDFEQQDGDPPVSSEINLMGYDPYYQKQKIKNIQVEYIRVHGKQGQGCLCQTQLK